MQVRIVLAALPSAASRRANELISAWSVPASSCLDCRKRGSCAVMASALFLWPIIRSQACPQAGDFKASPRQGNDPQGPCPQRETRPSREGAGYLAGHIPPDRGLLTTLGRAALRVTEMGATRVAALRGCGVR